MKKIILGVTAITVLFAFNMALAKNQPNGTPFSALWEAIAGIQTQIDEMVITAGDPGAPGEDGADGLSCWDLNEDYTCDTEEDINDDAICTALDCKGEMGEAGECTCAITVEEFNALEAEVDYLKSLLVPTCSPECVFGTCIADDVCECDPDYLGDTCSEWQCFGFSSSNPFVCFEHGTCVDTDICECDLGWTGDSCADELQCFGYSSIDPSVCFGHGICVDTDVCECAVGFFGDDCSDELQCFGIASSEPTVCSGHGICVDTDVCECNSGWIGDSCASLTT